VDDVTRALLELAQSPWLYVALFALVVGDAFLVILPSETVVVALVPSRRRPVTRRC
jgi:membrane-associated protein